MTVALFVLSGFTVGLFIIALMGRNDPPPGTPVQTAPAPPPKLSGPKDRREAFDRWQWTVMYQSLWAALKLHCVPMDASDLESLRLETKELNRSTAGVPFGDNAELVLTLRTIRWCAKRLEVSR